MKLGDDAQVTLFLGTFEKTELFTNLSIIIYFYVFIAKMPREFGDFVDF